MQASLALRVQQTMQATQVPPEQREAMRQKLAMLQHQVATQLMRVRRFRDPHPCHSTKLSAGLRAKASEYP